MEFDTIKKQIIHPYNDKPFVRHWVKVGEIIRKKVLALDEIEGWHESNKIAIAELVPDGDPNAEFSCGIFWWNGQQYYRPLHLSDEEPIDPKKHYIWIADYQLKEIKPETEPSNLIEAEAKKWIMAKAGVGPLAFYHPELFENLDQEEPLIESEAEHSAAGPLAFLDAETTEKITILWDVFCKKLSPDKKKNKMTDISAKKTLMKSANIELGEIFPSQIIQNLSYKNKREKQYFFCDIVRQLAGKAGVTGLPRDDNKLYKLISKI